MSRRYGNPVQVTVRRAGQAGRGHDAGTGPVPTSFTWRGRRYWVEVIGTWHLQDRWWDTQRHSDRHYFRVVTADHQVFEFYHDTASDIWVLDIVQD